MRKLLILYVLLILYSSLYPWHFSYNPDNPFLVPLSDSSPRDLFVNFWIYSPIGALAYLSLAKFPRLRWLLPVALGTVISVSVELAQYYLPGRVSSLGDIFANVVGTAAGMLIAFWASKLPAAHRFAPRSTRENFLLLCWAGYLILPFLPVHGPVTFLQRVAAFRGTHIEVTGVVIWTIAWMVAWSLIPDSFSPGTPRALVFLALLALLPTRFIFVTRVLYKSEVLGALAAVAILWLLRRSPIPSAVLAALIGAAIVLRGLEPFAWSPTAASFDWRILGGFLDADWMRSTYGVALKMFWYGAAVWALARCGLSLGIAGGSTAGLLLVLELLQRHIPPHVPEITDPLIALGCAAGFWAASRHDAAPENFAGSLRRPDHLYID
jgi:VanZ family protein